MLNKPLRRGDDRTLTIANLRTTEDLGASFLVGDVLRFTLRQAWGDDEALIALDSATGGVVANVGFDSGTVTITADDWSGITIARPTTCVADLELTRDGEVTTLWADEVLVRPDATH